MMFKNPAEDLDIENPLHQSCRTIRNNLFALLQVKQEGQNVLGGSNTSSPEADAMMGIYSDNCQLLPVPQASVEELFSSPKHAVLRFMVAVTPDPTIVDLIMSSYSQDEFSFGNIETTSERESIDGREEQLLRIHNIPGSINPVKVHRAYVQLPHGDSTVLSPVWKVCL